MSKRKVSELHPKDHPNYRAKHSGIAALSNAELIQLVGRFHYTDTAPEIASRSETLSGLLRLSIEELSEIDGVGEGMALAIKAAFELGRRMLIESAPEQVQIHAPADAAAMMMGRLAHLDQEHLVVLLLDTRHKVIASETVYKGSVNTALIRVGEVYKEAVRRNAAAILVCHNHPSGSVDPSPDDVAVTREIVEAGKLLDIDCLDHLIVGRGGYTSLRERGLGGWK